MVEYDLEEIKREIVEGRAVTIKTNNAISALAAELKSITKRQQGYERRMFVHSVAAYLVAVLLVLGLSKLALDAQVDAVRAEHRADKEKLVDLDKELAHLRDRTEASQKASQSAEELYRMLKDGDRTRYLVEYPKRIAENFSPVERAVLEDGLVTARRKLAQESYQSGVEHARAGRYHEATLSLRHSLELDREASFSGQATFELARAHRALDQQRLAIPVLIALSETAGDPEILEQATLLLAECQRDIQLHSDAKATLRTFLRRFGKSALAGEARRLLGELDSKR